MNTYAKTSFCYPLQKFCTLQKFVLTPMHSWPWINTPTAPNHKSHPACIYRNLCTKRSLRHSSTAWFVCDKTDLQSLIQSLKACWNCFNLCQLRKTCYSWHCSPKCSYIGNTRKGTEPHMDEHLDESRKQPYNWKKGRHVILLWKALRKWMETTCMWCCNSKATRCTSVSLKKEGMTTWRSC